MILVSENVYIEKLDEIVNKYHNTNHSASRVKCVNVKSSAYIDFNVKKLVKILNLKLVIM